jgi:hypothetical protein
LCLVNGKAVTFRIAKGFVVLLYKEKNEKFTLFNSYIFNIM